MRWSNCPRCVIVPSSLHTIGTEEHQRNNAPNQFASLDCKLHFLSPTQNFMQHQNRLLSLLFLFFNDRWCVCLCGCTGSTGFFFPPENATWTGEAFMQNIKVWFFQSQLGTRPPLALSLVTPWQRRPRLPPPPHPGLAELSTGRLIIPSPGTINTCLPSGRWEVKAGGGTWKPRRWPRMIPSMERVAAKI